MATRAIDQAHVRAGLAGCRVVPGDFFKMHFVGFRGVEALPYCGASDHLRETSQPIVSACRQQTPGSMSIRTAHAGVTHGAADIRSNLRRQSVRAPSFAIGSSQPSAPRCRGHARCARGRGSEPRRSPVDDLHRQSRPARRSRPAATDRRDPGAGGDELATKGFAGARRRIAGKQGGVHRARHGRRAGWSTRDIGFPPPLAASMRPWAARCRRSI